MARTLINIQPTAKRGEIIEIRATIGHPMETGFRPGDDGKLLPRNIIQRFSCRYNGELIFSAEMFLAMAANPYISFFTTALQDARNQASSSWGHQPRRCRKTMGGTRQCCSSKTARPCGKSQLAKVTKPASAATDQPSSA